MDSISPLAKILAEANGIDWRSIQGSGEGGSIVEQDILNYLSRIMSGDEEPPATPVDEAPPGWTGEMPPMPAAVAASGLQALSAAGVESDITDFVAQQAQSGQVQSGQSQSGQPQLAEVQHAPSLSAVSGNVAGQAMPQPPFAPAAAEAGPELATGGPDEDGADAADADLDFELDDDQDEETMGEQPAQPGAAQPGAVHDAGEGREQPYAATAGQVQPPFGEGQAPAHQNSDQHTPLAALPEAVGQSAGQSAYDPVARDEEADFVLADTSPAASADAAVHEQAAHAAPADAQPSVPALEQPAFVSVQPPVQPSIQPPVQEAAPSRGGFGLGGFLSRLYGAKNDPVQPETTAESVPTAASAAAAGSVPHADLPGDAVLGEPLTPQLPPIPDTPVAAPLVADQWRDQEALPTPDQTTLAVSTMLDHPELNHSELGQPIALPEAHEGGLEADNLAAAAEGAAQANPDQPHAEQDAGLAAVGLMAHAAQEPHEPAHEPAQVADQVMAPAQVQSEPAQPERIPPAAEAQAASQAVMPGSRQAITLRLNVDLGVLEAARVQLSEALVRDVPLSLLVARAAVRSLTTLGLTSSGGVALADHAGQPLAADLSGDFRASLTGLTQQAQATPALLVLDAAELGLDELHRGECSLSVGRAGGVGSALSLRGEVDPVRGAHFLHEVAALLNTPIRLLF